MPAASSGRRALERTPPTRRRGTLSPPASVRCQVYGGEYGLPSRAAGPGRRQRRAPRERRSRSLPRWVLELLRLRVSGAGRLGDRGRRPECARGGVRLAHVVPPSAAGKFGASPAVRQTSGKRTPRYATFLGAARRHSSASYHAQRRARRHAVMPVSTAVAACARRRSGVRLPCGPPLLCRQDVLRGVSESAPAASESCGGCRLAGSTTGRPHVPVVGILMIVGGLTLTAPVVRAPEQ